MAPHINPSRPTRPSAAIFLLAVFATLSIPPLMMFADRPIAWAMADLPIWLRNPAEDITNLGKSLGWLLLSAGFTLFWAMCAWRAERKNLPSSQHRRRALGAAFFFATVALSGILTNLIKLAVGRSRPKQLVIDGYYDFQPWHLDADLRAFPSGHATTMFAMAFAIAMIRPPWRWPAFVFAIVISATRVIINAHYLSDVIGGLVVALVTAVGLKYAFDRYGWSFSVNRDLSGNNQKPRIAP
jgi:membrane-associated phospholipid phosphatase